MTLLLIMVLMSDGRFEDQAFRYSTMAACQAAKPEFEKAMRDQVRTEKGVIGYAAACVPITPVGKPS